MFKKRQTLIEANEADRFSLDEIESYYHSSTLSVCPTFVKLQTLIEAHESDRFSSD